MKSPYKTEWYCEKFNMWADFLAHYEIRQLIGSRGFSINDITCLDADKNCIECNARCPAYKEVENELRSYCISLVEQKNTNITTGAKEYQKWYGLR